MRGEEGNALLNIIIPRCSSSSHIRSGKGQSIEAVRNLILPLPAAQKKKSNCSPRSPLGARRAILGRVPCPTVGSRLWGRSGGRGDNALCLHLCTHSHTQTHTRRHARRAAAERGNTEGIKHLAPLECLPWKQAKDNTCLLAPGSLPLATV